MRFVFAFLIFVHGLIHLMGFLKAFEFASMPQLKQNISKARGWLWLFAAILLTLTAILYVFKKDWWIFIAFLAIIRSQVLILMTWKDAKFGTIPNVIILLIIISAYGNYRFNKNVNYETQLLLEGVSVQNKSIITNENVQHLPDIVQKWMQQSGVLGKEKIVSAWLKQKGEMKTKPSGKWMPFEAEQHFDITNPGFVWSTEVDYLPMTKMVGMDTYLNGEGDMLIKLAGFIPVVEEGKNEKINQAAMLRYMAEMVWFPSAALNEYMTWETIDDATAKAIFTKNQNSVSGLYKFSPEGNFESFEAQRYYGAENDATLETWHVQSKSFKEFSGIRVPNKCQVIWKLKEGDFNWLNFEITDLKYNVK